MTTCYINGTFCESKEAQISAYDLGFLRGAGIFDVFRTYQRRPLFLKERLIRLAKGAYEARIALREPLDQIEEIVYTLIDENPGQELIFRLILTKGVTEDWITPLNDSSLIILISPFTPLPTHVRRDGIDTITTKAVRTLPQIKSLNYLPATVALEKAKAQNAEEALYVTPQNEILEGTRSNFFAIKRGELITADRGIYGGFTRRLTLKVAKGRFPITLRPLHIDEIPHIDEAFITASIHEITPVVSIDQKIIGKGVVGDNTKKIAELLSAVFTKLSLDELLDKPALHFDRT